MWVAVGCTIVFSKNKKRTITVLQECPTVLNIVFRVSLILGVTTWAKVAGPETPSLPRKATPQRALGARMAERVAVLNGVVNALSIECGA